MASDEGYRACPLFDEHRQLLDKDEVDNIVRMSVRETLISLGIDATDPMETQRDFQTLRDWRKSAASIRSKSIMVLVGIVVTGALAALWVGIRYAITGKP